MSGEHLTDPKPNGDDQKPKELTDVERLQATNKRLLDESMSYKEKYKLALKEKEDLEASKIAESGDIAQQLELEKKKAKSAMDELGRTKKKVVSQAVRDAISKYAGDVYSIDDLMSKPKLKEYLKQGLNEDSLEFNDESAKAFVDEIKKDSPYLWRGQGPIGARTSKPSGGMDISGNHVDVSKMTPTEMKEYMLSKFK
jgi:hypothetical protein